MTEQSSTQNFRNKLNTFVQPFKPLGQAILIFAKTTTGKTIGVVVLAIIVVSVSVNLIDHTSHDRNYHTDDHRHPMMIHGIDLDMNDPRVDFEEMKSMIMSDDDREKSTKENLKEKKQSLSKISINNDKKSGYSLSIANNIIQGTFIGVPTSGLVTEIKNLK